MSCHIVTKETVDFILTGMYDYACRSQFMSPLPDLAKIGYKITSYSTAHDLTDLGQHMLALNESSVVARYGGEFNSMVIDAYEFRSYPKDTPINTETALPAVLKNLECFLYQCDNGDTDDVLYQALQAVRDEWAFAIVHQLAQWKDAPWGIDQTNQPT